MIAELKKSIENSDFSQINEDQPDVIADISGREAKMHNATGRLLKNIPLTSDGRQSRHTGSLCQKPEGGD